MLAKTGPLSLNNIVSDLGLTNSYANLNQRNVRCRSRKFSGANSISNFRGRQVAIQDTVNSNWGFATHSGNWQNYKDWYAPDLSNEADYRCDMVGTADTGYFDLMDQHIYQGGGDIGVMGAFTAYVPEDTIHTIRWDQYQQWSNNPLQYYTKLEVVGFSAGYGQGSVSYLYNPASGVSGGIGSTSNSAPFYCASNFPYVHATFWCIVKSAAVDGDYHEVRIGNVTMDKD